MAFFRNATINLLNLHYGIHSIALGGGSAFVAVYLAKSGVPVPVVFVALAAILLGRYLIRPFLISWAGAWGLRALVIVGTLLSALRYPLIGEVHGIDAALIAFCVVSAVGDTIYWSCYHAYFAALGDDAHRGQQVGMREGIATLVGIVSPLVTGWMLVAFGPGAAFGATAVSVVSAALPLLWAPDVVVARDITIPDATTRRSKLLFAADGWIAAGNYFAWQIALFQSLHESLVAFGGALAIAALAGAVGGLVLGRVIDAGHGRAAVWTAFGTLAVVVVLRALATDSAPAAVAANALGALGGCLTVPTVMKAVYGDAKGSACTLRFHVVTEGGWDLGGASGLLVAAALAAMGLPLWVTIVLALVGVAAQAALLQSYYTDAQ